ncbi:hypothetical protein Tco_0332627 [Tanacetum coccineum]
MLILINFECMFSHSRVYDKTRDGLWAGIARPESMNRPQFELYGQFLIGMITNILKISVGNLFKELLLRCPQHYLIDMKEVILNYKGLDVPTKQFLDSKVSTETSNGLAAIEAQLNNLGREIKKMNEKVHVAQVGSRMTISRNSSRILPKEQWKPFVSRVKTNNGRITKQVYGRIYKRNEENSNLIKEIRASTDAAIRNQGASVKALEIQIEQISKNCESPKGVAENILVWIDIFVFLVDIIFIDMPEDLKISLILGRPFLSTAHANIDVFKRKITLRVGNDKDSLESLSHSVEMEMGYGGDIICDDDLGRSSQICGYDVYDDVAVEKPTSNITKRVYVLSLRERMELYLEARLMGEALILNRSLNLLYGDFIELNDLNEPLELRRNQVDDLEPTIEEGEFSCMIGYEHVNVNFFPLLSINVMSKSFYNLIMKDKVKFKGKHVVGAIMNVPIFVRNFYVITNFVVIENIDTYRDDGMGDIIVGRPFVEKHVSKQDGLME